MRYTLSQDPAYLLERLHVVPTIEKYSKEVFRRIKKVIASFEDLLTTVQKRKEKKRKEKLLYGMELWAHTRLLTTDYLQRLYLQGTVREDDRKDRQRKRWTIITT